MGDAAARTLSLVPEVVEDERETAFLLWAYECGQNAAETARRLGIPVRTVQDWVKIDGWRGRLDRERKEVARVAWAGAEAALSRAVDGLVNRLYRIGMGEGDTKTVLDKQGNPVTVEIPVPYQAQVNAANSLLDRVGLVAAGRPADAPSDDDAQARPMTLHERIERQRRALEEQRDKQR